MEFKSIDDSEIENFAVYEIDIHCGEFDIAKHENVSKMRKFFCEVNELLNPHNNDTIDYNVGRILYAIDGRPTWPDLIVAHYVKPEETIDIEDTDGNQHYNIYHEEHATVMIQTNYNGPEAMPTAVPTGPIKITIMPEGKISNNLEYLINELLEECEMPKLKKVESNILIDLVERKPYLAYHGEPTGN